MKWKITLLFFAYFLFLQHQGYAQCDGALFEERSGIAVIEAESVNVSGWAIRSGGSSVGGGSYLAYTGSNNFNTPGVSTITYKVKINSSGTYRFIWRNKVGIIASTNPSTEHNDSWLKFPDASNFYAQKGSSRIYPIGSGKTPTPNGAGSGGWFKVFLNGTTNWTWATKTSDNDSHDIYAVFNNPGVYTIQVSGRSNGHFIDRMVLYKESSYSASQAQNLTRAETRCSGGGTTPPPPPPPSSNLTIASFQYINTDTDKVLGTLTNGMAINLNDINSAELNFSAVTQPGTVGSVRLDIAGTLARGRTENGSAPYSVFGDSGANYYGRSLQVGNYTLTATPYSGSNLSGSKGATKTISFSIVNGGSTPTPPTTPPSTAISISSFQYINTDTDRVLGTLTNGMAINLNDINNAELNFSAVTQPGTVGSVRLDIAGTLARGRTENGSAPYSVFGDSGANYYGRNLQVGNYTLTATPYSGSNLSGSKGETKTISFSIVNGGSTPTPPTTPPPSSGSITGFVLVNADNNSDIGAITEGKSFDYGALSNTNLSIRAEAVSSINSIVLSLTGQLTASRKESNAPYSLFGDIDATGSYMGKRFPAGNYTISGTSSDGSKLFVSFKIVSPSSLSLASKSYAYPNPVPESRISLKVPNEINGTVLYSLVTTSGVEMESGTFEVGNAVDAVELDLRSLVDKNSGVYYLMLSTDSSKHTVPLIKK